MQCEVCGDEFQQLMIHTCGKPTDEPCGPLFESREHNVGASTHMWRQLHNCVRPSPDDCWFCEDHGMPEVKRPACCR